MYCKCGGPLLGHIGDPEKCTLNLNEEEVQMIILKLQSYALFKEYSDKLDTRFCVRICSKCDKMFNTKHSSLIHQRTFHKQSDFDFAESEDIISANQLDARLDKMCRILELNSKPIPEGKTEFNTNNNSYLLKNRKVPSWVKGQDFDSFIHQLRIWDQ